MIKCTVIVPLYKERLSRLEELTLKHTIYELKIENLIFIGPFHFDYDYYAENFLGIEIQKFEDHYFESVQGYSKLLLNIDFYKFFKSSTFILIYQTDALMIKNEIDLWCDLPFDYVGAPWPKKFEYVMKFDNFHNNPTKIMSSVGNGGLSLRRVKKCISLIQEFPELHNFFLTSGSSEDLFFGTSGCVSKDFIIPNEVTASMFSLELLPNYYFAINGGVHPMGGHAWERYDPNFWYQNYSFLAI